MGTKVNIMDMQVDLLTKETLKQEMQNFLENETVNVVHVISLDYMDAYDKNEQVRESLAHADLVLPGEKAILTRHHVDVLETGGMAVDYHAVLELLSLVNENNRTIYLVLRSEKEAKMVYRFLSEYIDRDQIVGVYAADGEVAEESLINDIIKLSELDEADHQMEMERIDLYKLAENCVQMMQVTAEKQGIRLTLQGESTMAMANKGLMDEVFYNLCSNAIRYNKPGGSVTVTVGTKDERPFLSVADTGIGIPKECQERVFERFYRVDKSRSKSTGGTGLGLAIVKHIVAQHNAALHLDSELDEGTTIEIVF